MNNKNSIDIQAKHSKTQGYHNHHPCKIKCKIKNMQNKLSIHKHALGKRSKNKH